MVTLHNSAVWPVPYACAQPYHPGSGSMRKFSTPTPLPLQKNNGPSLNLDCLLRRQLGKWREIFVAHHKAPKYKSQFPLGPVHTYPFLFENAHFFSAYGPHASGENDHRKLIFSKTLSRAEIFENAGFSFTCGRTKTEIFGKRWCHTSFTTSNTHALWGMLSYFHRFSVLVWTGQGFEYATCGRVFKKRGIRVDRASDEKCSNFPNWFLKVGSTLGTGNRTWKASGTQGK